MGTLRDAILSADDLPTEDIETPEWAPFGAPTLRIRGLSAAGREQWENVVSSDAFQRGKSQDTYAKFAILVVIDPETGDLAFKPSDAGALSQRSGLVLQRIFDRGRKLSGMISARERKEDENPSTGDLTEPSSSGSPLPSES